MLNLVAYRINAIFKRLMKSLSTRNKTLSAPERSPHARTSESDTKAAAQATHRNCEQTSSLRDVREASYVERRDASVC
jgi:hypothetical protein